MTKVEPRYPELSRLLAKSLDERQRDGRPLTIRGAAKALAVSPATFAAWKGGDRAPRAKNIRQLAELLYADDSDARLGFIETLTRAVSPAGMATSDADSFFERKLKVGVIHYDPISRPGEPGEGFLDSLLRRLFNYGELNAPRDFGEVDLDSAVELLSAGYLDIIVGMMATVDRAKHIHFIPTPISLPVNGVVLIDHIKALAVDETSATDKLREALTDPKKGGLQIHPILRPHEVGGLYCRLALGLSDKDNTRVTIASQYDKQIYYSLLEGQRVANSQRFPLVVADELMCVQVLQLASGKAKLLFPLADPSDSLPRYSIGFAVSRKNTRLISYLEEVFPIYLRADLHFLCKRYRRLYDQMQLPAALGFSGDAAAQHAKEWATKALSASPEEPGVPAQWRKIVESLQHLPTASQSEEQ